MTPIVVTAKMRSSVCLPTHSIALDALLAAAVCVRDGIPPALGEDDLVEVEIPLAREPAGRFHLASVGAFQVDRHERRHVQRRAPIEHYKMLGGKIGSVSTGSGPDKGSRVPMPVVHPVGGQITWWAIALDIEAVRGLLGLVSHLGKRRGVGIGHVSAWTVERVEPWDGFPVLLPDGNPTRNLPEDWPGVRPDARRGYRCLSYPYWRRSHEVPCFVAA